MFKRLPDANAEAVEIIVDGRAVSARRGESVAVALLACGTVACRATVISGRARGPYCMMGVCFDCLVTIDGVANQQACMVRVHEGMRVDLQQGAPRIGP